MTHPYADLDYDWSPNFRDNFKVFFEQSNNNQRIVKRNILEELVRPRLRIAIVTETWPPEINGVALSLLQLCKGLQKLGHKILLIRPEQLQDCHEFVPNKTCTVKAQSIPKYASLQFGWPQFLKVRQAIQAFSSDIVHIVTEGPLGLSALQSAKQLNLPVSSGFHSPFQDMSRFFDLAFLVKPIQRYLRWFHNSTQLTCVPNKETERALRTFGVSCKLCVVGRGVDIQRFSISHRSEKLREKWGAAGDSVVMLYVGRLSPEKQIGTIIDAYQQMLQQGKNVRLVVVGDGPDHRYLTQMLGAEKVVFTGALSGDALTTAYASADVFVFASQVETFGNVVLEAMASALPVVAFDYACAQQYVVNGLSGWLVAKGDEEGFKQALYQLPERLELQRMGKHAIEATRCAGWEFPVQQFEQALYQVVQSCT
jgi:glycosyltransferase involved in cell wall biosynthesis